MPASNNDEALCASSPTNYFTETEQGECGSWPPDSVGKQTVPLSSRKISQNRERSTLAGWGARYYLTVVRRVAQIKYVYI